MSDELRSAPGHRPEQRRNRGAPAWWAALDRSDLPEDDNGGDPHRSPAARPAPRRLVAATRVIDRSTRLRNAAITAVVVFIAALVAWIGIGGGSLRSVLVVLLVFGVPALLAVVTATLIVRRSG
ncbi:MAG: hypothetical protein QOE72_3875 [Chloroflexota bacterium]|jgi:hypothetical protein|nr:hypothetical protein [Chloroflexota bacterium]